MSILALWYLSCLQNLSSVPLYLSPPWTQRLP
jgi:hypothetical protein